LVSQKKKKHNKKEKEAQTQHQESPQSERVVPGRNPSQHQNYPRRGESCKITWSAKELSKNHVHVG